VSALCGVAFVAGVLLLLNAINGKRLARFKAGAAEARTEKEEVKAVEDYLQEGALRTISPSSWTTRTSPARVWDGETMSSA